MQLSDMENLCLSAFDLRDKIREHDEIRKKLVEELDEKKSQLLMAMEEAGLKQFKSSLGRIELREEFYIKMPDDKEMLFDAIAEQYGQEFLQNKLTIHANSVKALVNEAVERAADEGEVLNEVFGQPIHIHKQVRIV